MNAAGLEGSFAQQLFDWGIRETERFYPARLARPIHTVGILGAGLTGSRIACLIRQAGWNLVVVDVQQEALNRLARQFGQPVSPLTMASPGASEPSVARGTANCPAPPNSVDSPSNLPQTRFSRDPRVLAECDFVLECVSENMYIKQQVFRQAESLIHPQAILATNTSTIPLARLADGLQNPFRFCGMHFFMPIPYRPVVELVRGSASSVQTLATAARLVRRLGMIPLVVDDGPGFLANRLLLAWLNEALQLLEEGHRPEQIDQQAQEFGWALGPFGLMDWIGLDVVLAGGWQLAEQFGDRLVRSAVFVNMVKKGQFGRKTGLGFYRYPLLDFETAGVQGEPLGPNPDLRWAGASSSGGACCPGQVGFDPPQRGTPILGLAAGTQNSPPSFPGPDAPDRRWGMNDGVRTPPPTGGVPGLGHPSASGVAPSGSAQTADGHPLPEPDVRSWYSPPDTGDGIVESVTSGETVGKATCLDRLHGAMLVEVEQMLQEGYIQDPRQVDLVLVGGLGFPAHHGGLLAWADRIGLGQLLQRIQACPAPFRNHSAYRQLWERAHTHRSYYRPGQQK